MEFKVTRTSTSDEISPCKEAYVKPYIRIDERTADSPSKVKAYIGEPEDWWYSRGKNHRVENGHIMRDFDSEGWFVKLDGMEDLLKFQQKYGRLVIGQCWNNRSILEIEIYDTWRELKP